MPFYKLPKKANVDFRALTSEEIKANLKVKLAPDCTVCGRQIFVGVFFDGTSNNENYYPEDERTNVSHLGRAQVQ